MPTRRTGRAGEQGRRTLARLRTLRTRLEGSFLGRCVASFVELQGIDRAMSIASQAFTALIPLLIVVSAALPTGGGNTVADSIIRRFGLTGSAARSVQLVFEQSGSSTLGLGSLLLLAFSGLSLTRRLQRLYLEVFRLPARPGVRGSIDAALGLGALLVGIALLYYARSLARALPFHWVLGMPVSVCASIAIWTSMPWLLLNHRIPWQRLLPVGVLAGTAATLYSVATTVYMQHLMTSYSQRYGLFGVTVAIVGWLLCIALIVVATAVVGAELDRAPDTWARRLRGRLGVGADVIR